LFWGQSPAALQQRGDPHKGGRNIHPTEIIEILIVGSLIASLLIISFFLRDKWRKVGGLVAVIVLVAYCLFFVVRPCWIDAQVDHKVKLLKPYLKEHYPDEEWVISTVSHRENGYKHLNPYIISVVFDSEPEVIYGYLVESKDNIYQVSYTTDKGLGELKHLEERNT
jgi:hypothetical protein